MASSISPERLDELEQHARRCRSVQMDHVSVGFKDHVDLISAARKLAEVRDWCLSCDFNHGYNVALSDILRIIDREPTP